MNPSFSIRPFPRLRHLLIDVLRSHRPHTCYSVSAVDITDAQAKRLELQRRTRQALSLHAWIMHCLIRAALDHPEVLTYRHKKSLVTFNGVDIGTVIDRRLPNGVRIPVGWVLRSGENLTLAAINSALRVELKSSDENDPTTVKRRQLLRVPSWIRRLKVRQIMANPHSLKQYHGNIGLTNLQAPGLNMPFMPMPPNIYTLTLAIGSISREFRPDSQGSVSERALLHITGAADHAVIDGAPLAAFSASFFKLLQEGYGLDEMYVQEVLAKRDQVTKE